MMILAGVKSVENRCGMSVERQGRCAISVSKGFSSGEYARFIAWANETFGVWWCVNNLWDWNEVREWRGKVVATCDYEAVAKIPDEPKWKKQCAFWNEGYPNWWLLSNVRRLPTPIPCRGNVGMWPLTEDLSQAVAAAECRGCARISS